MQRVFKSLSLYSGEKCCSVYQASRIDRIVISILYKPGVSLILEMRRVNQFLIALILLSVKFRSYRTSDLKLIIDFVDVQTFMSPM